MAINPMTLMQLKTSWDRFMQNHPKFPNFLKAVFQRGLTEGTVVAFTVTTPDGQEISSNLKLSQDDMDTIRLLQELMKNR